MDVHDEFVPEDVYAEFLRQLPQVCVELVVEHEGSVLLCHRTNEPARGEWFWPGSRLYKGEELTAAAHRVADEELGVGIRLEDQLGTYGHFWDASAVDSVDSRHTINVVYHATLEDNRDEITLDDQHDDYRFVTTIEPIFHPHVRQYLEDSQLME